METNNQGKLGYVKPVAGNALVGEILEVIPTGTPEKIRESRWVLDYVSWLRAGYTTGNCSQMALSMFQESISDETFRRLQVILRERKEIRPNYKQTLLSGEAPKYDIIQEMRNVIALRFRRIAEIYEKEKTMQLSMGSVPYVSGAMQEEQNALSRELIAIFQMEQKTKEFDLQRNVRLGIIDDEEIIDIEASNVPSEIEVKRKVSAYTAEQAHAMKMALMWAQKVYLLELIDNSDVVTVEDYGEAILVFSVKSGDPVKAEEFIKLQYHEYWFGMSQEIRVLEQVWVRLC